MAAGALGTAATCGAVEVPIGVENQFPNRISTIAASGEVVHGGIGPGAVRRGQLENGPPPIRSGGIGGAEKVPRVIKHHRALGRSESEASYETVKRVVGPAPAG